MLLKAVLLSCPLPSLYSPSEVLVGVQACQVAGLPGHNQDDGCRQDEEGEEQREEGAVVAATLAVHVVPALLHPRLVLGILCSRLGLRTQGLCSITYDIVL